MRKSITVQLIPFISIFLDAELLNVITVSLCVFVTGVAGHCHQEHQAQSHHHSIRPAKVSVRGVDWATVRRGLGGRSELEIMQTTLT